MYVHLIVTHKTMKFRCVGSGCEINFDRPSEMLKHARVIHGNDIVEEY